MPDLELRLNQRAGSVQFLITDDDSETTVTIMLGDGAETLLRKLRKVLELTEPPFLGHLAKRCNEDEPKQPKPDPAKYGPPPPPPDWLRKGGDVEMIEPGEEL